MRVDTGTVIEAVELSKTYASGPTHVTAVDRVDLAVGTGSLAVIKGRSGSGKTTLLNLLGGLDTPSSGLVRLHDQVVSEMDDQALAHARRTRIGFIFQSFGLIPILTAAENVEVPLRLVRAHPSDRRDRAGHLLDLVGLGGRAQHRPAELSGGEQQRVAVARALANSPTLLLADEPTGQLDSRTGAAIVELLAGLVESEGLSAVVATHDQLPIGLADQVFELADGRLVSPPA